MFPMVRLEVRCFMEIVKQNDLKDNERNVDYYEDAVKLKVTSDDSIKISSELL